MSCVIDAIVGKILDPIFDYLFSSIGRQIGYVAKYKENIKNLEEELKHLKYVRDTVQAAVDIEKANGMTIKKVAEEWLEEVEHSLTTMEEEFKEKTNIKCLDVRSRYRLGKKGKKMAMDAIKLKQNRNEFGDDVAHHTLVKDIWCTSSTSYEQFSTRASIFEEIMKALRDDKNSKIGIYGMAGVGKTTMVEEVGKQAEKGPFDEVAMAVFSQNPDLKKIQGKLADCLNLTLDRESEEGRAGQLYNRLKNGKKILVILDDVWDDKNTLKKIGIPADTDDNSMGCKILLTSRRLEVCKKMGFEKTFQIGLLSLDEAWHLFKRTVGNFIEVDPEIHSVAQQVCRECDHLPLAICAVGGALSGSDDKHIWNDALEQLKHFRGYKIDGVEEKVYSCIEWSYKYLKLADVRSCFLHCSLFPEDTEIPIDLLVTFGVGTKFLESTDRASMKKARDRTLVIVGTLKKSNLLLEGRDGNKVKMHDVVRDVAISIASKDNDALLVQDGVDVWPDKDDYACCKAISLRASCNVRLPDRLECLELRTLVLGSSDASLLELPNSFFKGMKRLEVVVLNKMKLVPSSLSHLVGLRMLCLSDCESVNLSFIKELKDLEILVIGYICEFEETVLEIGQLTHLRFLDLREFNKGIGFSSGLLSCLSNLEELYISGGYNGWSSKTHGPSPLAGSFSKLRVLKVVELSRSMKYLFSASTARCLPKLHELRVENCEALEEIIGGDEEVTDKVIFHQLKELGLKNLPNLRSIYANTKKTSTTESSTPSTVTQPLFNEKVMFPVLENLYIEGLHSIKAIWDKQLLPVLKVGDYFQHLQELKVLYCEDLEEIIGGDEEVTDNVTFHQFKKLDLMGLPNLKSIHANTKKTSTTESSTPSTIKQPLFNEKVMFPVLEVLTIIGLHSIKVIWDKQLLPVLKVGDSVQHLQELNAFDCEALEEIIGGDEEVTDNVTFHQLKKLRLTRLPNLKSIYANTKETSTTESSTPSTVKQPLFNEKVMFPVLEVLTIIGLDNIKAIWDKQLIPVLKGGDSFQHLQELEAGYCKEMEEILAFEVGQGEEEAEANDEIPVFPHLKIIELWKLSNLKSSKEETKESRLQALVNHKVRFPSLEYLII